MKFAIILAMWEAAKKGTEPNLDVKITKEIDAAPGGEDYQRALRIEMVKQGAVHVWNHPGIAHLAHCTH